MTLVRNRNELCFDGAGNVNIASIPAARLTPPITPQ
jgi:hypothetical protein